MEHESHKSLDRAANQERIDEGDMIGNEQSRTAGGNVFPPYNPNPVERMRDQPEYKSNKEIREFPDHVCGGAKSYETEPQNHVICGDIEGRTEKRQQAGCNEHRRSIENIIGCDEPSLIFPAASLLQQSVQGHRKKARRKAHQDQGCACARERISSEE